MGGSFAIGAVIIGGSILVVVIVLAVVVGGFFFLLRRSTGHLRKMAAMAVTPISQAPPGALVKIRGTVRAAEERLSDPFLQEACVAYSVLVEQNRGGQVVGENLQRQYQKIASDKRGVDFLLDDGTGTARISGELATFLPRLKVPGDSPSVGAFLTAQGVAIPAEPLVAGGEVVREGMTLIAIGEVRAGGAMVQLVPPADSKIFVVEKDGAFLGEDRG